MLELYYGKKIKKQILDIHARNLQENFEVSIFIDNGFKVCIVWQAIFENQNKNYKEVWKYTCEKAQNISSPKKKTQIKYDVAIIIIHFCEIYEN